MILRCQSAITTKTRIFANRTPSTHGIAMFSEVKEHATGRLHQIFTDPYSAFDNLVTERHLHLQVALQELVGKPMAEGRLILRLLYGWEHGNCDPAELLQRVPHPASLNELKPLSLHYQDV